MPFAGVRGDRGSHHTPHTVKNHLLTTRWGGSSLRWRRRRLRQWEGRKYTWTTETWCASEEPEGWGRGLSPRKLLLLIIIAVVSPPTAVPTSCTATFCAKAEASSFALLFSLWFLFFVISNFFSFFSEMHNFCSYAGQNVNAPKLKRFSFLFVCKWGLKCGFHLELSNAQTDLFNCVFLFRNCHVNVTFQVESASGWRLRFNLIFQLFQWGKDKT